MCLLHFLGIRIMATKKDADYIFTIITILSGVIICVKAKLLGQTKGVWGKFNQQAIHTLKHIYNSVICILKFIFLINLIFSKQIAYQK